MKKFNGKQETTITIEGKKTLEILCNAARNVQNCKTFWQLSNFYIRLLKKLAGKYAKNMWSWAMSVIKSRGEIIDVLWLVCAGLTNAGKAISVFLSNTKNQNAISKLHSLTSIGDTPFDKIWSILVTIHRALVDGKNKDKYTASSKRKDSNPKYHLEQLLDKTRACIELIAKTITVNNWDKQLEQYDFYYKKSKPVTQPQGKFNKRYDGAWELIKKLGQKDKN